MKHNWVDRNPPPSCRRRPRARRGRVSNPPPVSSKGQALRHHAPAPLRADTWVRPYRVKSCRFGVHCGGGGSGLTEVRTVPDNVFRTGLAVQEIAMASRLDVRLDAERRRRLEELVKERGEPISDVVRCLIDDAYDDVIQERRRLAVQRLVALEVEDPPDAATLSRELEAAHEPGGLH